MAIASNLAPPMEVGSAPWRFQATALFSRRYPFLSGCAALANHHITRSITGESDRVVWTRLGGKPILVPLDDFVGRSLYLMGDLDRKISALVSEFMKPGDVGLDIGANLGVISLRMASRVGKKGRVHAFDPNPRVLRYLQQTLDANAKLPIRLHKIALGRSAQEMTIAVPEGNLGSASIARDQTGIHVHHYKVPVYPLSDYAAAHEIDRIDFIKMDVEGHEAAVLEGARNLLRSSKPKVIVFEEHRAVTRERIPPAFSLLSDLGYRVHMVPKRLMKVSLQPLRLDHEIQSHDYVALRIN